MFYEKSDHQNLINFIGITHVSDGDESFRKMKVEAFKCELKGDTYQKEALISN